MTQFLINKFIKDKDNIHDNKVRTQYGTLSSLCGIFCNIFLFIFKYILGTLVHSISITSDAFNNLSDCISCIVTLFGYHLANKPADEDHPFGHGRLEYMVSIFIAVVIFIVGYELLISSFDKIIHPQTLLFSFPVVCGLIFTILIKVWMSSFNKTLGLKINNSAMLATSKDSLNDCIATFATLLALLLSPYIYIDGYMGILVSFFIIKSGYEIIKETLDELLGKPVDKETLDALKEIIYSYPEVLGFHDLIIHNYGTNNTMGSCHIEVNSSENLLHIHDVIDEMEREIESSLHIIMTCHMDPLETEDEKTLLYKEKIEKIVKAIDINISIHDFRLVHGRHHIKLIFDILLPYSCSNQESEITDMINKELNDKNIRTIINYDRPFIESVN